MNVRFKYLLVPLLFFAAAFLIKIILVENQALPQKEVQKLLTDQTKEVDFLVKQLEGQALIDQGFDDWIDGFRTSNPNKDISTYVFVNQKLKFWSDNLLPDPDLLLTLSNPQEIKLFKNGWYLVRQTRVNDFRVFAVLCLAHQYPYENDYLQNNLSESLGAYDVRISNQKLENSKSIESEKGEVLFYISEAPTQKESTFWAHIILLFVIATWITIILALYKLIVGKRPISFKSISLFLFGIVLFRLLSLMMNWNSLFGELPAFNPSVFASSWLFRSFADMEINIVALFFGAFFLQKMVKRYFSNNEFTTGRIKLIAFSYLTLVLLLSYCYNDLWKSIINNSDINFQINNLYELNFYSYLAIGGVAMLLGSYFHLLNISIVLYSYLSNKGIKNFPFILLAIGIHVITAHLMGVRDLGFMLWPEILLLILLYRENWKKRSLNFGTTLIIILLFSILSAYVFDKYSSIKEKEKRVLITEKLSDQDPVAEFLYQEVQEYLIEDELIIEPLRNSEFFDFNSFENTLLLKHFGGYWNKYDLRFHVFNEDSTLLGQSIPSALTLKDYAQLIQHSGKTVVPNFYQIKGTENNVKYLSRIPFVDEGTRVIAFLVTEFITRINPEEIGFPELLLDGTSSVSEDLMNYSMARYYRDTLIQQNGYFHYKTQLNDYETESNNGFFNKDGHSHYIHKNQDGNAFILSKPEQNFLGRLTIFSYLFAYYGLSLLMGLFIQNIYQGQAGTRLNLKTKIQLLVVLAVMTTLILFGVGTQYYIKQQNAIKNKNLISEKIESVLIELNHKLTKEKVLDESNWDELAQYLTKFSYVFFTDINMYDLEGNLLASSRPQIFKKGLISEKMNAIAFHELNYNDNSKFVHDEEIGNLSYLSAYVPFKNEKNEVLAYLNLPYFARQGELEQELSGFLVAIINIFIFLIALSIIGALFFSNWITRPLKILQEGLATIQLGKSNKLIEYRGTDEIAGLVHIYNEKVRELEKNAEKLAKSERESAWREMAKQVAHEIKNPLTPMKLSIQHLQRSLMDKAPDWDEKFEKASVTLIEQIETLSSIATAFSDFAQMPKARQSKLKLKDVIEHVLSLYGQFKNVEFVFRMNSDEAMYVYADKDQITRVFSNLIKNAIQAIPEDRDGKIEINLLAKNLNHLVEIKDNGIGIQPDQYDKIFEPNFTTKTQGMGLGLAMVKNLVENSGGEIWFESIPGQGTTFLISLPRV